MFAWFALFDAIDHFPRPPATGRERRRPRPRHGGTRHIPARQEAHASHLGART
jgi:hypothetical protein